MTDRRLIEVAFPLKQASLDSVHEKNVRHGHISTLHIWPARRPLAACRAALIATLLPDPGTPETRRELCERIGGRVIKQIEKKKGPGAKGEEKVVEKTVGGILHWGRETENKADIEYFRQEIRKAFGGRAPRVLDPFAGGGAIPLEAMRLGCEVTAIDVNPVAWLILKCTLDYPQKLAGQRRPLPDFVRTDAEFMESFFKAQGFKGTTLRSQLRKMGLDESRQSPSRQDSLRDAKTGKEIDLTIEEHTLEADLSWHVRAWGWWVLREARRRLARYYPTYADFEPLKDVDDWRVRHQARGRPMTLVPLLEDGTADIDALNAEFSDEYLADARNPRWVAKPTAAYLWARTVKCKNCRATIPLLKTCWLAKKDTKRTVLRAKPNAEKSGVDFDVETDVPSEGGNNAQRREHDRHLGQGTMSRAGAWCPCCGKPGTVAMEIEDIRAEGVAGRLGLIMTAVAVEGSDSRAYRPPTAHEILVAETSGALDEVFEALPFQRIVEPIDPASTRSISCNLYGIDNFDKAFTSRQQLALGVLVSTLRSMPGATRDSGSDPWAAAVGAFNALAIDRVVDRLSVFCRPDPSPTQSGVINTFSKFALPMTWDFIEGVPIATASGSYVRQVAWIALAVEHCMEALSKAPPPAVILASADDPQPGKFDVILTDPPYYQAISYADLSDLFYIWLKRIFGTAPFDSLLADKSREAVQHVRHDKDPREERKKYEERMANGFLRARAALSDNGRFVIVFAHKDPLAWETLVTAMIQAGLVATASWPIQTEMSNRGRAITTASLASSLWLVCRKRPEAARAGWDNVVLAEMKKSLEDSLRHFWDAGIRGPDFVWAATGPALESYSKHPVVKKANDPGQTMSVSEFLRAVRRLVVEFVVGLVLGELTRTTAATSVVDAPLEGVAGLDDVTTYYLLHRHDFGMNDAPAGACILYALSCNLSEADLAGRYGLLLRTGGVVADEDGEPEDGDTDAEGEVNEGSGSAFKLRPWKQRRRAGLGAASANGVSAVPLVDTIHHLMHLWVDGDVHRVDAYIDERGVRRSETFHHVLQALIELADEGSDERSVLERISKHLQARGQAPATLRDVGLGAPQSSEQE